MGLIETATAALEKFYTDNNLALVQIRRSGQPFVEAGEAPTPPPSTWGDGGYKGSQGPPPPLRFPALFSIQFS